MKNSFYKRSFLTLKDFSKEEILYLIDLSIRLKKEKIEKIYKYRLKNKNIALLFEKTSTRTRCAASVACFDEGAHAEFLGKSDIQLGKKESVKDTARVLGRMFDAIIFRGFKHDTLLTLSEFSKVPVINGLTDDYHPTQVLADFMTIKERFNRLDNIKIAFLGDGNNNMANSLLAGCAKIGLDISIAAPKTLYPTKDLINYINSIKKDSEICITEDVNEAIINADVVYTDVWLSMGEEKSKFAEKKVQLLKKYRVNSDVMKLTGKSSTIFLHCLPASHESEVHNLEVTDEVFESEQSLVFEQAENRMHTIKAILSAVIGEYK
ncbi:MAG: ornithine carbamoyltransferase [Spirochaetes bacterium]|nr:ornithine carbamoyltransferase [Spirochaetota bacterium]